MTDGSVPPPDPYGDLLGLPAPAPGTHDSELAHELASAASGFGEGLARRLRAAGVDDVPAGLRAIGSLIEDPLARDRFVDVLVTLFEVLPRCADPDMAMRNLDRFARATLDRVSLYGLLRQNRVLIRFLTDLFSFSQFLSDILIRNPEYLEWLLSPDRLDSNKTREAYEESLRRAIAPFRKPETIRRAVCRWKRRELLRIGVRDMLGKADIRQCARELSWQAEAVIAVALKQAQAECRSRFGIPLSDQAAQEAKPTPFAIYGMGKLGGEDLNFSSDIDLIFVYGEEGRTTGTTDPTGAAIHRITNHEYFTRLGERIIAFLSDPSDEGLLYRVDMRLRPEGRTGPLVRSKASYTAYFAEQGRPWEKVAYLKARMAAGDEDLQRRFDESVVHFVFTDIQPAVLADELARLKVRIDQEVLEGDLLRRDLKRGLGGIREIEFIASYFQILEGARDPSYRTRDTVEALRSLGRRGVLDRDEATFLADTYFFLRRLEHRVQMMAERQTYVVPETTGEWGRLARRNGDLEGTIHDAGTRLRHRFEEITKGVRAIFVRTFGLEESRKERSTDLVDFLLRGYREEELREAYRVLSDQGFQDPPATLRALRELAFGTGELTVSSTGQRWFELILPRLLEQSRRVSDPDAAVRGLDAFLRAAKGRTLLYEMLASTPAILRMLLAAFGSGAVLSRSLIAHPEWFDEILETGALAPGYEVGSQEPRVQDAVLGASDDAVAWQHLRRWKEKMALILGLLEVLGIEDEGRLGRLTADLADICLRCVAGRVERRLVNELGTPHSGADGKGEPLQWTLFGLGGFGGRHVSHFSDLDVVLVYSDKGRVPGRDGLRASHWYSRLGEELISVMTAVSPDGQLFKVDARLRPEGRNAPLAATLERYVTYYEHDAQTWEWQAALKARCVAGDADLAQRFLRSIWARIPGRFADGPALAAEVRSMRERLANSTKIPRWAETDYKRGQGGLVDVDFILQFLQLKTMASYADADSRLGLAVPETPEALKALVGAGALTPEDAARLREDHAFLRTLQRRARLLFETGRDFFPEKPDRLDPLRRALAPRLPKDVDLVARFHEVQRSLRDAFERLVK